MILVLQELARRDQLEPNSPMSVNLHPSGSIDRYSPQNSLDSDEEEDDDDEADEIPLEGEVSSPVKEKKQN